MVPSLWAKAKARPGWTTLVEKSIFRELFENFQVTSLGSKVVMQRFSVGKMCSMCAQLRFSAEKTGMVTAGGASRGSESRGSTALRHERPRASFYISDLFQITNRARA